MVRLVRCVKIELSSVAQVLSLGVLVVETHHWGLRLLSDLQRANPERWHYFLALIDVVCLLSTTHHVHVAACGRFEGYFPAKRVVYAVHLVLIYLILT